MNSSDQSELEHIKGFYRLIDDLINSHPFEDTVIINMIIDLNIYINRLMKEELALKESDQSQIKIEQCKKYYIILDQLEEKLFSLKYDKLIIENLKKLYHLIDELMLITLNESEQSHVEDIKELDRLIHYLIKTHSIETEQSQDKIEDDAIIDKFAELYLHIDGLMEKEHSLEEFVRSEVKIEQYKEYYITIDQLKEKLFPLNQ